MESLRNDIEKAIKGEAGSAELKGYKDMRPLGIIIKETIDEKLALPLFGTVEKFVRDLSTKHFKV